MRKSSFRKTIAAIGSVALLGIVLASCGGDAEDVPPEIETNEVPEATLDGKADGPPGPEQWAVMGQWPQTYASTNSNGLDLGPGKAIELVNLSISRYIGYDSRDYGINLGWYTSPPLTFIRFATPGGGPILNCGLVAIHAGGARPSPYVVYGSRTYGINLVWSPIPVYEWRIQVAGKSCGEPVRVGTQYDAYGNVVATGAYDRFGLFNTRIARYVVYGKRTYGINLVWY
ncbi:MAG: hypothetical protein HY698_11775 [Deltaproteobacteria bacterium]|nr:hypothetical protein [Deltaproteobacteria bacterium]